MKILYANFKPDTKLENKFTRSCQEFFPLLPHLSPDLLLSLSVFSLSDLFCLPRSVSVDIFQSLCCDKARSTGSTVIISLALVLRCEVSSYICHCLAVAWAVENNTVQVWRQTVVTKKRNDQKSLLSLRSVCIRVSTSCSVTDIMTVWVHAVHLSDSRRLPENVEGGNSVKGFCKRVISLSSQGSFD